MKTLDISIPYTNSRHIFNLYAIGDIHAGTKHCQEKRVDSAIATMEQDEFCAVVGTGDYCLPLKAKILTKNGFKDVSQLAIGELVAAYDDGKLKWTELESIHHAGLLPMIEMKSKSFYARSSPNHKWIVTDTHQKKRKSGESIYKVSTSELKKHHRIITNAPLVNDSPVDIKLTADEASIIGWLVTDGSIRTQPCLNANISQTKEPFKSYLRLRFGGWFTKEYTWRNESTFHLKTVRIRELLEKLQVRPENLKQDLPYIVTRIDGRSRMAMIEAMVQAEGWMERDKWHFSQKKGPVLEAFQILSTLCGFRLGASCPNSNGVLQLSFVRQTPVDVANLTFTKLPPEQAWCPKTKYGSWVMLLDGQISITGNCEFIGPNDKRFDIESLASWVKPANICTSQEEWITKKFKKLAGQRKLKVLLEGNHEATRKSHDNQDVMENICTALDVPNGGHVTCIRFFFDREHSQETHMFTCIFTHGSSGAITLSGKVAALVAFMGQYTDTDLFGYAHTHALVTDVEIPKLCVTGKRNEPKVSDSMRNGALTGSYFTTYTQGISPSYGEKKNYTPNTLGCVRYELNIRTHDVNIFKV